jgi:Putative Flp pilus-assembly TadE/G-like
MRRLKDRGASGVFIAICLVFLIGFAGLAVDAGALYAEKTELQKGAEAAALAIAEDCGHGTRPCDLATAGATADSYVDANATDLAAAIDSIDLDLAAQEVTVADSTERDDGGGIFLPFFAQVVGFPGTTVNAQASAAWGAPSGLATLPIIISECEWGKYGGDPATWPDHPDAFATGWPSEPIVFTFHDGHATEDCNAQAGHDADGDGRLPGGFGWLVTGGSDCEADTHDGDIVDEDPGSSPSNGCDPGFMTGLVGTVVFMPWFNDVNGLGGANGEYVVAGYSPFYVTGMNFAGQYKVRSLYDGDFPCQGDDRCIEGYFVTATATEGDLGGEYRGVLVVKLTG